MSLVIVSPQGKQAVGIWGFNSSTHKYEVAEAVKAIAGKLTGSGHTIHIMTGTHGYCDGKVGQVATREERFLEEDRELAAPLSTDGKSVALEVHDFNNNVPAEPNRSTAVMAKLNGEIRRLVPEGKAAQHTFLLAYCCSSGTY